MSLLIRTPEPKATESFLGYVLRTSEANGYESPKPMLMSVDAAGITGRSLLIPPEKLSELVGWPIAQLQGISNLDAKQGDVCLLGKSFGSQFGASPLRLRTPAFCPHCVAETRYIDAVWDLALMAACPKHQCEAIHKCYCCGKDLGYQRPGLLTCKCGADLAQSPITPASTKVTDLMEVIEAKVHGKSVLALSNQSKLPLEHLEPIPLSSLCEMLQNIARHALDSRRGIAKFDDLLIATKVAETLTNWPHGYHQFLREIDNKFGSGNDHSVGLAARYKEFFASMFVNGNDSKYSSFLRDELIRFGCTNLGSSIVSRKAAEAVGADRRWVSKDELCRLWGVTRPTVKRLLENSGLPVKKVGSPIRRSYLVDISSLDIEAYVKSEMLNAKAAALLTDVPKELLFRMRRNGVYKVANPAACRGSFYLSDLERFNESILTRVVLSCDERPKKFTTLSLYEILHVSKFGAVEKKANFVAGYLAGEIIPIGRYGDSMKDILFSKDLIRDLSRRSRIDHDFRSCTLADAASILRCTYQVVPTLAKLGYLDFLNDSNRKNARLSRESVDRFSESWLPAQLIARDFGISTRRVQNIADENRISRLIIQSNYHEGEYSSFFNKVDAARLSEHIKDLQNPKKNHIDPYVLNIEGE